MKNAEIAAVVAEAIESYEVLEDESPRVESVQDLLHVVYLVIEDSEEGIEDMEIEDPEMCEREQAYIDQLVEVRDYLEALIAR